MDKTALIYEFNNESPVFAQVAATELENKNIDKALTILENGIQLFPDYATAYLIYAQALAIAGDFENAEKMLRTGCDIIESDETFKYYSEKFGKMKSKSDNISVSRRATFLPDNFNELSQEDINQMQEEVIDEDNYEEDDSVDELELLATELEKATMPRPETEPEPVIEEEPIEDDFNIDAELLMEEFDDQEIEPFEPEEEPEEEKEKEIVSETLAGIYFAQGSYEEALTIYEKLLIYQPDKSEFFKKRINEIKKQLEDDSLL